MVKVGQNSYMLKLIATRSPNKRAVYLKWSGDGTASVEVEYSNGKKAQLQPTPMTRTRIDAYYGYITKSMDSKSVSFEPYWGRFTIVANQHDIVIYLEEGLVHYSFGMCYPKQSTILGSNKSKRCVYSTPFLEEASYRLQSSTCPQLAPSIKQELEKEKQQCQRLSLSENGLNKE